MNERIMCCVCGCNLTEDKFKVVLVHKNVTKKDVGDCYSDCELELVVCNNCSENLNFRAFVSDDETANQQKKRQEDKMPQTTYDIIHCGHSICPELGRDEYMKKKWYSEEEYKVLFNEVEKYKKRANEKKKRWRLKE